MPRPTRSLASAVVLLASLAGGCTTSSTSAIRPTPQDLPQFTIHSYDGANGCVRKHVHAMLEARNEKVLFILGPLGDLTKSERDPTSGPLSFAGATMLKEQLSRYGSPRVILQGVTSSEVRDLLSLGREFGRDEAMKLRLQYGMDRMFLLTGGFVGFDQARSSSGAAGSGGYRSDHAEINAESGKAMESGRLDFILEITDVLSNRLLGTISLSGTERRRSASTRFTLEVRGVGLGFASQNVEVDGTHNVQASIIAAAHFYMWQMILPGNDEAKCLTDPASSPARFAYRASAFEAASSAGKIAMVQGSLNRMFGKSRKPLKVDGILGPGTWAAIREAEARLGLAPASRGDLTALHEHLLSKGF